MLPLQIDEVGPQHIAALVADKVTEHKTLEYKEKLPDGTEGAKKEFLADVSSFANSSGGDIVFGIRDQRDSSGKATGVPEKIVGLSGINLSAQRERLEAIIRDGIKPKIPGAQTRDLEIQGQGSVVLLRVGRSWIGPHMVSYAGTSRFYSRHSTGKYQLDVQEIGLAFAEQRALGERLREWRTERIAKVLADEGPLPVQGPSRLLLHFVPAGALAGQQSFGPWPLPNNVRNLLRPSSLQGTVWRYNADGFLVASFDEPARKHAAYVQLFRNGSLEYVDGYILNTGKQYGAGREQEVPSKAFEEKLVNTFGSALLVINRIGINDPIYFSAALTGVKGMRLSRSDLYEIGFQHTFDREIVQTPEMEIDRAEEPPYRNSVLPIANSIWQANGYEETPWLRTWGIDRNPPTDLKRIRIPSSVTP
jgi:hypothetical protein